MPKPRSRPPAADLAFEQAFQELETVVRQLESEQLPLEEALGLFERGQALAARCQTVLDQAELKLQVLTKKAEGEPTLQPFTLEEN